MAIVKHIKSRNANYSDALNYLIFQHDESTGKMILDEFNRPLRRDELYVDGLNCNPDTFDVECYECNEHFKKNRSRSEIKSHHYIISFDPDDKSECGLTGEKAQELCLNLAQKIFPGYQALIVTHTDGHNGSGNIHTHIVINSVRKEAVRRQSSLIEVLFLNFCISSFFGLSYFDNPYSCSLFHCSSNASITFSISVSE